MHISYLRQVKYQPSRLEALASQSYTNQVINVLKKHRHYFYDAVCLRVLRKALGDHLTQSVAKCVRDELFRYGCSVLHNNREHQWSAVRDFLSPDLFVLFLSVFYTKDLRVLELPGLVRQVDRVMVLDLLNNVGTPGGHELEQVKIRMFDRAEISVEESYIFKRVIRGFANLRSLTIWKACDNGMLQILGVTCRQLEVLDIWKSTGVTDEGVLMFLGLEAEKPFKVCSTLRRVAIKDTSITDRGAFHILFWCLGLECLDFSSASFLHQFLCRLGDSYLKFDQVFCLRTLFLPVSQPLLFHSVVKALPHLQELSVWTALRHLPDIAPADLPHLDNLKLGGLSHATFLREALACVGPQLVSLKLETIYFDVPLDAIGAACTNLEELSIINAKASLSTPRSLPKVKTLQRLRQVYLFLVQYTDTQVTALHYILMQARRLESIQVTGTPYLTDTCIQSILRVNPLTYLKRFVMSHPVGQDQPLVVPLTAQSVTRLHKSCRDLQCIGDLKYWSLTPVQRRKLSTELGRTLAISK